MKSLKTLVYLFALKIGLCVLLFIAYPLLLFIILWDKTWRVEEETHRERVCRWAMMWSDRIMYVFGSLMFCPFIFRLPVRASVSPPTTIIIGNHRSSFDILIMLAALRRMGFITVRGIAKSDVAKMPVIGRATQEMGGVLITRKTDSDDLDKIRQCAVGALREGGSVMLFPEGTTYFNPAFVSRRFRQFRYVLPPRATGLKTLYEILPPETAVLSFTIDWGDIVGADTIFSLKPLVGKRVTIEAQYIPGPGKERLEEWLNNEWKRKDRLLADSGAGA